MLFEEMTNYGYETEYVQEGLVHVWGLESKKGIQEILDSCQNDTRNNLKGHSLSKDKTIWVYNNYNK